MVRAKCDDIYKTMSDTPIYQQLGIPPWMFGALDFAAMAPRAGLLIQPRLEDESEDGGSDDDDHGLDDGVITQSDVKTKRPQLYKVLMLNDDYTPMEFVVHVLQRYFRMTMEEATQVMLHVHQKGVGVCGVFPYDVAETKVNQVMDLAKKQQHPLQCTLEKE